MGVFPLIPITFIGITDCRHIDISVSICPVDGPRAVLGIGIGIILAAAHEIRYASGARIIISAAAMGSQGFRYASCCHRALSHGIPFPLYPIGIGSYAVSQCSVCDVFHKRLFVGAGNVIDIAYLPVCL